MSEEFESLYRKSFETHMKLAKTSESNENLELQTNTNMSRNNTLLDVIRAKDILIQNLTSENTELKAKMYALEAAIQHLKTPAGYVWQAKQKEIIREQSLRGLLRMFLSHSLTEYARQHHLRVLFQPLTPFESTTLPSNAEYPPQEYWEEMIYGSMRVSVGIIPSSGSGKPKPVLMVRKSHSSGSEPMSTFTSRHERSQISISPLQNPAYSDFHALLASPLSDHNQKMLAMKSTAPSFNLMSAEMKIPKNDPIRPFVEMTLIQKDTTFPLGGGKCFDGGREWLMTEKLITDSESVSNDFKFSGSFSQDLFDMKQFKNTKLTEHDFGRKFEGRCIADNLVLSLINATNASSIDREKMNEKTNMIKALQPPNTDTAIVSSYNGWESIDASHFPSQHHIFNFCNKENANESQKNDPPAAQSWNHEDPFSQKAEASGKNIAFSFDDKKKTSSAAENDNLSSSSCLTPFVPNHQTAVPTGSALRRVTSPESSPVQKKSIQVIDSVLKKTKSEKEKRENDPSPWESIIALNSNNIWESQKVWKDDESSPDQEIKSIPDAFNTRNAFDSLINPDLSKVVNIRQSPSLGFSTQIRSAERVGAAKTPLYDNGSTLNIISELQKTIPQSPLTATTMGVSPSSSSIALQHSSSLLSKNGASSGSLGLQKVKNSIGASFFGNGSPQVDKTSSSLKGWRDIFGPSF
eukprot:GDKJ01054644.1.p1 GENE.GDKJ01054644.1~~GDKJ01054644.1.p1  ORF type:complete len:693 (+),score=134.10 GDKJ01054644.1:33-2111(+)